MDVEDKANRDASAQFDCGKGRDEEDDELVRKATRAELVGDALAQRLLRVGFNLVGETVVFAAHGRGVPPRDFVHVGWVGEELVGVGGADLQDVRGGGSMVENSSDGDRGLLKGRGVGKGDRGGKSDREGESYGEAEGGEGAAVAHG